MDKIHTQLARQAIVSQFKDQSTISKEITVPKKLKQKKAGAFVSLHDKKNNCLRGCIGTLKPTQDNLGLEIINNAIASAFKDPRFMPLKESELDNIKISVDVIGKKEKIDNNDRLNPQKYGLIVKQDLKTGLLLPKIDGVNTVKKQIKIACRKAGINPNSDYDMLRFRVRRYQES